jgi:hypothetical protein
VSILLSVANKPIMLNVIMLNNVMLSVIMLNVAVPFIPNGDFPAWVSYQVFSHITKANFDAKLLSISSE